MKRFSVCIVALLSIASFAASLPAIAEEAARDAVAKDVAKKAAHVVPSPQQLAWQEMEFTAFAHFGVNTFTNREWGEGKEDEKIFNPTDFDADQWAAACKAAGIKVLILTCKHHDGFCLWPSKYTDHSVKNSPWRGGKGDVVREVSDACRKAGIKFGVYLSPWDRHEKTYGTPAYNEYYKNQLRELLTNYGEVAEVWWDGACGEGPNGKKQVYDFAGCTKLVRELQPNAVAAICGPDIRWVGNENGLARETEWSVQPAKLAANASFRWHPAECDVSIRPGWFYHASEDKHVKSLWQLLNIYYCSIGRNSELLLNIPPDRRGRFHENDVARLKEFHDAIAETFKTNLAAGKAAKASSEAAGHSAAMAVDGRGDTYWTPADGTVQSSLEIDLGAPAHFDRAMLQEMVSTGQRVEQFTLEAWNGQAWKEFARGTTIGYKRLLRFPAVTASKVRLNILASRDTPTIREFGLFKASAAEDHAVPPGAAALGYTKRVIDEQPAVDDISPDRKGEYKWYSGQWYAKSPSFDHYAMKDGVLALRLGGDLVSTSPDMSHGKLPLLPGDKGFYVEFDTWISDNDSDHWPAVWLMPAEHSGRQQDVYPGDPAHFERFMELDVDEGGFGPGLTGTVHSTEGIYGKDQKLKHVQNPNNVSKRKLDRSKMHTFGASYDPAKGVATWWVDGAKQMSAGAPYVPVVAAKQHFYIILSCQSHGKKIEHDTFVSGVRAYVPEDSPLPEAK